MISFKDLPNDTCQNIQEDRRRRPRLNEDDILILSLFFVFRQNPRSREGRPSLTASISNRR